MPDPQSPDGSLSDDPRSRQPAPAEDAVLVLGGLFLSSATVVLAAVLLDFYPDADRAALVLLIVVSYVVGASLLVARQSNWRPGWLLPVGLAAGSVLLALASSVSGPQGSALLGVFYVFVAAYSFYYFRLPMAVAEVVLAGATYAVALSRVEVAAPVGQWIVVFGAVSMAGGVIGGLGARAQRRYRREHQRAVRLEASDRVRTTYLRAVAHDIGTPLTSLVGFVELLQTRGADLDDSTRAEYLDRLQASADKIQRIVDDLFQLDRLVHGDVRPDRQPTDLAELVQRTIEQIPVAHGRVRTDLEPVTVPVDAGLIERAIENLVANAAKYTPDTSPIHVGLARHEGGVLITVTDHGPGIPEEHKDVIFEPFTRGPDADRAVGTGMGLSLVREFAQLHGGRAWVEDADTGARFCLYLPTTDL